MNFFGHAHVAGWFSEAGPFVLGSMLPDFANVLGVAPPRSRQADLAAGIELHHETDRVFHECDVFRELEDGARLSLSAAGVSKGARRALAHIGVELLIDAELGRREPRWRGYANALAYGCSPGCGAELEWRGAATAEASERLAGLCSRLAASAGPNADTPGIARRLFVILASRPRLRLQPDELPRVERWIEGCRPRVAAQLPALIEQLQRGLAGGEHAGFASGAGRPPARSGQAPEASGFSGA